MFLSHKYSSYPDSRLREKPVVSPIKSLILIVFMTLFIGFRPLHSSFVDMWNYTEIYILRLGTPFKFDITSTNYIFDNLYHYLPSKQVDITYFFVILAAINFGGLYLASRKMFPGDTLYSIVIYLASFSMFNYATNGIKAGAAASIFLWAIAFYRNKIVCILLLFISLGFHHSMILPIMAFLVCQFYRNPKVYLIGWFGCLIIAALHISYFQVLFQGFADESGAEYLALNGGNGNYYSGFRPDFVLYSALPIYVGYWAIFKHKYASKFYNILFCTYLLTNGIWMLCMYASFTNRIAYLSWLMLPIVLIYPFFDKEFVRNQYKKLNNVAWIQLGFTLFMTYVYYVFIK